MMRSTICTAICCCAPGGSVVNRSPIVVARPSSTTPLLMRCRPTGSSATALRMVVRRCKATSCSSSIGHPWSHEARGLWLPLQRHHTRTTECVVVPTLLNRYFSQVVTLQIRPIDHHTEVTAIGPARAVGDIPQSRLRYFSVPIATHLRRVSCDDDGDVVLT